MRKPFYKACRDTWYVQVDGKQIVLAKGKANKEEALKEYHRLMAAELPVTSKTTVATLIQQFLTWNESHSAASTQKWYQSHCLSLSAYVKGDRMKVCDLRPFHVTRWLEKCYSVNQHGQPTTDNSKNGAVRAIARAFNWARKQGLIAASPIAGMERPPATPRDEYLSVEQWDDLIALVDHSDPFHDLLVFFWETGCRPFEARIADAKDFDRANRRIVLTRQNSKGKKSRRVIRLNDRAFTVVDRIVGTGPIFKNRAGRGWAKESLVTRFKKLSAKLGYRVIPYLLRHGFCTRALASQQDAVEGGPSAAP